MKIPNVLYHGTTRARWELGIKQNGLCGDLPRHLAVDYKHMGYVFLTSSKQEASMYAIQTYFFDEQIPSYREINSVSKTGVIIAVKTSNIRKQIEPDPELPKTIKYFKSKGILEEMKNIDWVGTWYRHKGNIAPTQIFGNLIVPIFHPQNEWAVNIYREGTIQRFSQKDVVLK